MNAAKHFESETSELFQALQVWHAFLLRKAGQRVTTLAEVALQPVGMTLRQFGVLSVVEAEPGQNQRTVGSKLRIDRTTIVALIDDLEQAGLLERRRGADRRVFALHLTTDGVEALARAREAMHAVHEEFLRPLSVTERDTLRDLLQRLASSGVPDEALAEWRTRP